MWPIVLFVVSALLLLGGVYLLWRYWDTLARRSPEEEAFDERVAALNERQAHRISDEDLAHPLNEEEAWQIMIRRGRRGTRSQRYGGDLARRVDDRRRRP